MQLFASGVISALDVMPGGGGKDELNELETWTSIYALVVCLKTKPVPKTRRLSSCSRLVVMHKLRTFHAPDWMKDMMYQNVVEVNIKLH